MSLVKTIKHIIAAGALALSAGCYSPQANLGFSTFETAYTSKEEVKNRAIVNASASLGDAEVSIHSLNNLVDGDEDTYFGSHRFMAGIKDFPVKLNYNVKVKGDEIVDQRLGIRDYWLVNQMGGKGFIEALADEDAIGAVLFYVKPLGNTYSLQATQIADFPFNGDDPSFYNEFQANANLHKHVQAFVRAEVKNFEFDKGRGTYMIGIRVK